MNKHYLTPKEFTTKYPDTKEFFKRQDRLDTKFYPFYGIEKSIIKIEDGRYQIPLESAPILALMIRAYANACGIDRRVANKKTGVLYSCEMYHEFIDTLQKGLDELPIYQKAFIQRYSSYTSAVIIDSFLPLLIERLTLLIVAFFKFSHSKNIDFISILLRSINECQKRRWENKDKFAEKFSDECKEGSKDHIAICNFYEWAQKSPLYEEVQERLKAVVSMLLPIKFAQTDCSNSKTTSSQK